MDPRAEATAELDSMPGEAAELPARPVERWLTPVRRFLHIESASGIVLLACTAAALVLANSPLAGWFAEFPAKEASGKVGTLLGSIVSAVLGAGILVAVLKKRETPSG